MAVITIRSCYGVPMAVRAETGRTWIGCSSCHRMGFGHQLPRSPAEQRAGDLVCLLDAAGFSITVDMDRSPAQSTDSGEVAQPTLVLVCVSAGSPGLTLMFNFASWLRADGHRAHTRYLFGLQATADGRIRKLRRPAQLTQAVYQAAKRQAG
jgi:hypothetical protein